MTDRELISQYASTGSERAFRTIVERHMRMVYSACYRILGDVQAAEDAAQSTFLVLARKGRGLAAGAVLAGWLYRSAEYAARNALRMRKRREEHERKAAEMSARTAGSEASWEDVRPLLDQAISSLPCAQRDVVVLRYMHGLNESEIAREMRWGRSRVSKTLHRVLDRLRRKLDRRGVAVSTLVLAGFLGSRVAEAAPAGLVAATQAVCLGQAAASAGVVAVQQAVLNSMAWAKMKIATVWVAAAGVAAAGVGAAAATVATKALPEPPGTWYAAPDGRPSNTGNRASPWDLESALVSQRVRPGDTVLLMPGTYKTDRNKAGMAFDVRLAGEPGKPVVVRPAPGARATVDGGLAVREPSAHLWIMDLELIVSQPRPPGALGGVTLNGRNCKLINLVVHDAAAHIGSFEDDVDTEIYGCLLHDADSDDRSQDSCITLHNKEGVKTISNCIISTGHRKRFTMYACGTPQAHIDDLLIEDNVCYDGGLLLVGGGRPSRNIRVLRNYLYNTPGMMIGQQLEDQNEDCEVRDNLVVHSYMGLSINNYRKAATEGNLVLAMKDKRPAGVKVFLLPNKYDPRRANLVIYNWERAKEVQVTGGVFLKPGEKYRLMDPRDFYGKPAHDGTCVGETIDVPVNGEFAVFVMLK